MDALASHTATCDNHFALGASLLLKRQMLTALSLLFIAVLALLHLSALSPAFVANESHNGCEEPQVFQGVQDARATVGRVFSYPISPFAFQGKITHYKVILTNGSALPSWLEFQSTTNTLQGLPMQEESGEYRLTVTAYGNACGQKIPTASARFALCIQDSTAIHEKEMCPHQKHAIISSEALCARKVSITFVEIIIHVPSYLDIQERLYLIYTMAEYLHLDPSSLILLPFNNSYNKRIMNPTILAEDIRFVRTTQSHYVGLFWPVGFGAFAMLYELIQVLRHNVESNSLSQLLGYEIAGWRILKKEGKEEKDSRKQYRRQLMATPRPTLRPITTEAFTVLSTALSYTETTISPIKTSSPLYKATAIPTYTDTFLHPAVYQIDLGTMDVQTLLHDLTETSTIFQYLSSELSPSLMLTSTAFADKVTSKTPAISELQSQVVQEIYSIPKKSKPKQSSTQYYLDFSMPNSTNHFSGFVHHTMATYVSTETIPSKMSSLTYFFGETTTLNYDSCYTQLTPCGLLSEGTISIVNLLSFRSTLMTPAEPSQFPFSSVVMSLLFSDDGYLNHDILSNHKYASVSIWTSPYTIQTEVPTWNTGLNFTDILSTFNSTTMMNASAHRTGLHPDRSPADHHCSDNTLALAMYSTSEFNISLFVNSLEIGLLLRSSSIAEASLYPSLSSPVELATSFGLFNILLTEKLLPDKASTEGTNISENTAESFLTIPQTYTLLVTKDKSTALTRTNKDTALWAKQPHSIYVSKSSAPILSSEFHSEENLHSSEVLLLIWPTEVADTPKLYFSTNEFDSYDSSIIRTHVAYPDALQLDENDLSLNSPLGTKMNFQMTRKFTSKLLEESTVTFHKELPTETGFYATTLYYGAQGQTNTSPRVVHAIQWVTATIGHKFSFSVPSDTFYDQEDGNTTQLTLGINPVAGSPSGQESWLQFNSDDQTMYGYPLAADFQYSPQEFLLFATDSGGLRTSSILTIEIFRPTTIPCHIYTVRTKNSYHSFLRDRERINLFFEKLSKYLTAGDIGNLVLLQLEPGSTVITWYSKSFCTGNKCAILEIQGVLLKLGAPGGNANLDFVEAMLPDYKIVQIEDVAYGGICLPTTMPLNESVTSNKPLATFMDNFWIRNISAFLISICITIMVILIAAFHYCKYHKKLLGSLSASVQGKPFLNYIDLEMDMLKSRKSPILEQEIPPSAHLWLPVPTPSHMYLCRPDRKLVASRLPPPPKYRLPPLYGKEQFHQTHNEL